MAKTGNGGRITTRDVWDRLDQLRIETSDAIGRASDVLAEQLSKHRAELRNDLALWRDRYELAIFGEPNKPETGLIGKNALLEARVGLLEKQRNAALWVLGVVLTVVITGSMGFLWMLLTNQVVIDLIRTSP